MATYYVAPGGTNGVATSWATAKTSVAAALAVATADGDIILVDRTLNFLAGAAITWTPAAANISIISVDQGTGVRTAGATESVNAAGSFTIAGINNGNLYVWGMTLNAGTSGTALINVLTTIAVSASLYMENCTLRLNAATTTAVVQCGASAASTSRSLSVRLQGCTITTSASRLGNSLVALGDGFTEIVNTSITATGASKPLAIFAPISTSDQPVLVVRDCDLGTGSGVMAALFTLTNWSLATALVKNCTIPLAPATGSFAGGAGGFTLRNCWSVSDLLIYEFYYRTNQGSVSIDRDVYKNSGAQFDGTSMSWRIQPTATATELNPFVLPPLEIWTASTSAQTATVETLRTATRATDRQLWSELDYASSTAGLYTYTNNRNAVPIIGAGTNVPDSTATWTGGGGTPLPQKLSHTFTPSATGLLQVRLSYYDSALTPIYIDPVITLS